MKASLAAQRLLLDIQKLDREIAKVKHGGVDAEASRRRRDLDEERRRLHRQRLEKMTEAEDTKLEIERVESDLAQVRQRQTIQQGRLDAGEGSAKELIGLEDELVHIRRRIATLEERQLELMEVEEAAREAVIQTQMRRDEIDAELASADTKQADRERDIAARVGVLQQERQALAENVPADLLDAYDDARSRTGGIGAVAVIGRRVEGMPMELSPLEADALRAAAPDDVVISDDYDVILVRVDPS
ncbi:MAG: hypothetical protein Q4B10_04330 [Actinomycetaceae bacterium]|nr:hypothetical protein [Actinomycetaceae bacterium]